jgi:ubiquinone/menaquinone biosynthesis C-methylase UbiE
MTHHAAPPTKGHVIDSAAPYYDLLTAALTLGRDRAFRERLVDAAAIRDGESVLDVGCGTGTLAVAAKRVTGVSGMVAGVDASPAMIDRANQKARRAGVVVDFKVGVAESLSFEDESFDVVFGTLMMHHLPRTIRSDSLREMRRILKPGGRVLIVEFDGAARGPVGQLHRRGHIPVDDMIDTMRNAGFDVVRRGRASVGDLYYVFGVPHIVSTQETKVTPVQDTALEPLPTPVLAWMLLALVIVGVHVALIAGFGRLVGAGVAVTALVIIVVVLLHGGAGGLIHRHRRRR